METRKPDLETVLPEPLVLKDATLTGAALLRDRLSLQFRIQITQKETAELLEQLARIGQQHWYLPCRIGEEAIELCPVSVTSNPRHTHLRCWARLELPTLTRLIPLLRKETLTLVLGSTLVDRQVPPTPAETAREPVPPSGAARPPHKATLEEDRAQEAPSEAELQETLTQVARAQGTTPGALLEELTTFTRKDGTLYRGVRQVERLSPRQRRVVLEKLKRWKAAGP